MSEQPGRYQRTTGGLLTSLVVLVAAVAVFVAYRGLFREEPDYRPPNVDYQAIVDDAAQAGIKLVHPEHLATGWRTSEVTFTPGDRWTWDMAILTAEGKFIGIHEEDADLDALLHTYIDDNPVKGEAENIAGTVAPRWQTYSDAGGDHAFVAEVGSGRNTRTVLVYGSAPVAEIRAVVGELRR